MEAQRLALDFEVPPVAHRSTPDFPIFRKLRRPAGPVNVANPGAESVQLLDQRLERLADTAQRRRPLFGQLELDPSLTFRGFSPAHEIFSRSH